MTVASRASPNSATCNATSRRKRPRTFMAAKQPTRSTQSTRSTRLWSTRTSENRSPSAHQRSPGPFKARTATLPPAPLPHQPPRTEPSRVPSTESSIPAPASAAGNSDTEPTSARPPSNRPTGTVRTPPSAANSRTVPHDPLQRRFPTNRSHVFRLSHILARKHRHLSRRLIFQNLLHLQASIDQQSFSSAFSRALEADGGDYYFDARPSQRTLSKNLPSSFPPLGDIGLLHLSNNIVDANSSVRPPPPPSPFPPHPPTSTSPLLSSSSSSSSSSSPFSSTSSSSSPPPSSQASSTTLHHLALNKPPRPARSSRSPLLSQFVTYGLEHQLLHPSNARPTGTIFFIPKPNSAKVRIIFDLRLLNESSNLDPTHLSLPSFDQVKNLLRSNTDGRVFFTKLDISNCYWSLVLPPALHHTFVFATPEGHSYALSRLPFGWNLSVSIASQALRQILPEPLNDTTLTLQYIDDFLVASPSRDNAADHTQSILEQIHAAKLFPADKSITVPDTSIEWLGKTISSSPPSISNTPSSQAKAYAQWIHFASSSRPSQHDAMRFTGSIVWAGIHTRMHLPYLSAAHRLAFAHNVTLSDRDRKTLLKAVRLANIPWSRAELRWSPPPIGTVLAFCDATTSIGAVVVPTLNLVVSWRIPTHASINQQAAELWTCIQSIKLLINRNIDAALGSDSLTSLYSLINLRTPSFNEARAKLLRSASSTIRQLQRPLHVFWLPSELNPADAPSRDQALAAALVSRIPTRYNPDNANSLRFVFDQNSFSSPSYQQPELSTSRRSTSTNSGSSFTASTRSTNAPLLNTSSIASSKAPSPAPYRCLPQPSDSGLVATSFPPRSATPLFN